MFCGVAWTMPFQQASFSCGSCACCAKIASSHSTTMVLQAALPVLGLLTSLQSSVFTVELGWEEQALHNSLSPPVLDLRQACAPF
jgi:hypothetical protein